MSSHLAKPAVVLAGIVLAALLAMPGIAAPKSKRLVGDGIVHVKSAYPLEETIRRLKEDIKAKGIVFFDDIDQGKLAAGAGIELHPSHLLVFGNPPLGIQFLTADPEAGLDWPVRLLVFQDAHGQVWTAYTDFDWIARRHGIDNRKGQFAMASQVIASITSSVAAR